MLPVPLLKSDNFLGLSAQAKCLLPLMQLHWRNDKPIDYGVREAAKKIPCAKGTSQKAFKELEEAGFIILVDESLFSSRTQSKSRTWRLTWMPFNNQAPSNEWKNEVTGSILHPITQTQGQICTFQNRENFHKVNSVPCNH